MIHQNSHKAYESIIDRLSGRHKEIWDAFASEGNQALLTDRQVKNILGLEDMNSVRPRITEMIKKGVLMEESNTKCPITGKTVRICRRNKYLCIPVEQIEMNFS